MRQSCFTCLHGKKHPRDSHTCRKCLLESKKGHLAGYKAHNWREELDPDENMMVFAGANLDSPFFQTDFNKFLTLEQYRARKEGINYEKRTARTDG